ncbi:hypothetical protein RSOLAG1IB_12494 [Rhizoctonia solani AG-1 IB]|uniref:Uncharacterized protein n=1 Tax=Thanatephorus cucumeris (strain AG1-IB / isolate 7/3/14) TaxID=1108050 RepID=M5C1L8_THACB|nr:hypothetical protein BN14_07964 [Rhizoctonia solani AG-1 IB]CEL62074.1 hypothetical protein RSOLAG1IB_12494 [Rhizoctonia solani AG-1 IB]
MLSFTHGLLVVILASPFAAAARLRDGLYKISYSPAPCSIETKHYLDLSAPTTNATFNPIPEVQAQIWLVTTSATDSTWRRIQSEKYPGISIGYPTPQREVRVRGIDENSEDFSTFNLVDTGKEGYYYMYPITSRDFVVNGDTRIEARNRFAYFRGNATQFPLPMLPLLFSPVVPLPVLSNP